MSAVDWVILILAVLCVAGAVGAWLYRRRHGKSGCGHCNGCPYGDSCPDRRDEE